MCSVVACIMIAIKALFAYIAPYIAPNDYEEMANMAWGLDSCAAAQYTGSETVGRVAWGTISALVPLCNEFADKRISRRVSSIVNAHYKKYGPERASLAAIKFAVRMHNYNPTLSELVLQNILDQESDNYKNILQRAESQYVPQGRFMQESHIVVGCTAGLTVGLLLGDIWYRIRNGDGGSILYGAYRCHAVPTAAGLALGYISGIYNKHEANNAIKLLKSFERPRAVHPC